MKNVTTIVCWKCKFGNRTLYNVKDENGNKTEDYICLSCMGMGHRRPDIGNSSFVKETRLEARDIAMLRKQKEEDDKTK